MSVATRSLGFMAVPAVIGGAAWGLGIAHNARARNRRIAEKPEGSLRVGNLDGSETAGAILGAQENTSNSFSNMGG